MQSIDKGKRKRSKPETRSQPASVESQNQSETIEATSIVEPLQRQEELSKGQGAIQLVDTLSRAIQNRYTSAALEAALGKIHHPGIWLRAEPPDGSPNVSTHKANFLRAPKPHPLAVEWATGGWIEPKDFAIWRSNEPADTVSRSERYQKALLIMSDWPGLLPYEDRAGFQDRQQTHSFGYNHDEVECLFIWRELNDPTLRSNEDRETSPFTNALQRMQDVLLQETHTQMISEEQYTSERLPEWAIPPARDRRMPERPIPMDDVAREYFAQFGGQGLPRPHRDVYYEKGWIEPEEFAWWRRIRRPIGKGVQTAKQSQSERYQKAIAWVPDWPAPLPYERIDQFIGRQESEHGIKETMKIDFVFKFWARIDPDLVHQDLAPHYRKQGPMLFKPPNETDAGG